MSFKDIKGQDKPISILKGYIEQSRLEGGYLFTGPEGVGKKLAAKTLAKQVNCLEDGLDACDRCASCVKIENNQHPDVRIIESVEPEIKIETIRQLKADISLRPYEGKRKAFIIDNAHKLTAEASGALLKILEEPPKGSLIILVSDKPALLFKTIISRCKALKFFPLNRAKLQEVLKENYSLDADTAHFLAYFSEGRLGCALRLKGTDILNDKNRVIDKLVLSRKPYSLENLPIDERQDVRNYLNVLAAWFRDIYFVKIGMPYSEIINLDRKDELLNLMSRFSFLDLNEIPRSISDSILYLERNINVKLLLYDLRSLLCKE
ncbi:MAG: DNA polymerase III subunit delta' [Candidatus Omnitrophota bacterium]